MAEQGVTGSENGVDSRTRLVRVGNQPVHIGPVGCRALGGLAAGVGDIGIGPVEEALLIALVDYRNHFRGKAAIVGGVDIFEIQLAVAQDANPLAETQKIEDFGVLVTTGVQQDGDCIAPAVLARILGHVPARILVRLGVEVVVVSLRQTALQPCLVDRFTGSDLGVDEVAQIGKTLLRLIFREVAFRNEDQRIIVGVAGVCRSLEVGPCLGIILRRIGELPGNEVELADVFFGHIAALQHQFHALQRDRLVLLLGSVGIDEAARRIAVVIVLGRCDQTGKARLERGIVERLGGRDDFERLVGRDEGLRIFRLRLLLRECRSFDCRGADHAAGRQSDGQSEGRSCAVLAGETSENHVVNSQE